MVSTSSSRSGAGIRHRVAKAGAAALLAVGALVGVAPTAGADDPPPPPTEAEIFDKFADCPELPVDINGLVCMTVRVYDGNLKLGGVEAPITEPIELGLALGLGPDLSPVIALPEVPPAPPGNLLEQLLAPILERTTACSRGIPMSGGLLGQPALDPILALDPVSALCVSATPEIGAPEAQGDGLAFLSYILGSPGAPVEFMVPISIQINNLLLGTECRIAHPNNPVRIQLTNGTTRPPEGVEPLTGSTGSAQTIPVAGGTYAEVIGSRFVDNGFAVPGARRCDILLGDLAGQPTGLFDSLINDMVGIPSAAGKNLASFLLDTESLTYGAIWSKVLTATPAGPLAFGDVAVGQASAPQSVVLENTGTASVRVGTGVTGANQPSWWFGGCVGEVLAPGASCTVDITFTPHQAGARNASFAAGGGATINLTGAGTAGTSAALTAPTVAFGNGFVNQASASQPVTFTNGSGAPVAVGLPAQLRGSAANVEAWEIVNDGCEGETVAPGGTCSVDVRLVAPTTGSKNLNLDVRGADAGFLGTAALTGAGILPLAAPVAAFGDVVVGGTAGPQAVTFTNNSPEPVSVSGAVVLPPLIGTQHLSWQIAEDGCSGVTVPAGGTCDVQVVFAPDSAGSKAVTMSVTSGTAQVGTASLTGNGSLPLTAPATAFGSVAFSGASTLPVTFTNIGGAPVAVASSAFTGTAANFPHWQVANDGCSGVTVPAAGTCTLDVTFAPTSTGAKNVGIALLNGGGDQIGTVALTGSGVVPLTAPATPFGTITVGDTAGPTPVVFTNGGGSVTVQEVIMSGTAARFTSWQIQSDTCTGATLTNGQTCTLSVLFAPDSVGVKTITLQARNSGVTLGSASVTGTGA